MDFFQGALPGFDPVASGPDYAPATGVCGPAGGVTP